MKHFILTLSLILGATSVSAQSTRVLCTPQKHLDEEYKKYHELNPDINEPFTVTFSESTVLKIRTGDFGKKECILDKQSIYEVNGEDIFYSCHTKDKSLSFILDRYSGIFIINHGLLSYSGEKDLMAMGKCKKVEKLF